MAEIVKPDTQTPYKLNRDSSPIKQPQGTYRFALNTVTDTEHISSTTNEPGSTYCVELPGNEVGSINMDRFRKAVFTNDGSISIIDTSDCTIDTRVTSLCFGFDTANPIRGEFREVKGCEGVIYWYNGVDPDRYFNFDRPDEFKDNAGEWDCNLFKLSPNVKVPQINLRSVNDAGGNLEYGAYAVQVEYLSKNLDILYRSYVSPYVPIYDGSFISTYNSITGAINLTESNESIGGKPATNKSITYTLENVDESFDFVRINVIKYEGGDNVTVTAHRVGNLIPIASESLTFTYTGFNPSSGDEIIDVSEVLNPIVTYDVSTGMEQVQNRLTRVNVIETVRDFSLYQGFVNQINMKWVKTEFDPADQTTLGNPKNPQTYWERIGHMGDEVYGKGIVFVYTDGSESPAFHIPAPAPTDYDLEELQVGVDIAEYEVEHLGLVSGDMVPRWKVYNTSDEDGKFGYYETSPEITYPTTRLCDESDYVFGELAGQPIRHPKFPCRAQEPVAKVTPPLEIPLASIFGVEFSNVIYPEDDIVGHYFVTADRDEFNKSVLDAGYLIPVASKFIIDGGTEVFRVGRINYTNPALTFPIEEWAFLSPKAIINREDLKGDHFVANYEIIPGGTTIEVFYDDDPNWGLFQWRTDVFTPNTSFKKQNWAYDELRYLPPRTIQPVQGGFTHLVENDSQINTFAVFHLKPTLYVPPNSFGYYVTNKQTNEFLYSNLFTLRYKRSHSGVLTNDAPNIVYGGDVLVSTMNIGNISGTPSDEGDSGLISSDLIRNAYVESELNFDLLHGGTDTCNGILENRTTFDENYFLDKITFIAEDGSRQSRGEDNYCEAFYGYNADYTPRKLTTEYNGLAQTYDYCSKCLGIYKGRIIYSEQSFQNDASDNFRVFKANNFIDLPSHTGGIKGIDFKDNRLVVRTDYSCYYIAPNARQMQTSEDTVYIGTGDFLSIPPYELNTEETGFGGQQHILESSIIEKGLVWADRQRGDIYLLSGQSLEVLTDPKYGMHSWFKKNLPGEGEIIFSYDANSERLIVTKRGKWTISFCFLVGGWKSWHSYIPNHYLKDAKYFYAEYDGAIHRMYNESEFTVYFALKFPHIVEFTVKDFITFMQDSIQYHSRVYLWNGTYWEHLNATTFDQVLAYNDRQSTGVIDLVLLDNGIDNIYYTEGEKYVVKTDDNFKISHLKDLAESADIWTTDITPIKQGLNQGWVDKLPDNIDPTIPQAEQGDFRDKHLSVRLFFNDNRRKMVTDLLSTIKHYSIR